MLFLGIWYSMYYLHQQRKLVATARVSRSRVLTSDEGYAILHEKEEKSRRKGEEKARKGR